MDIVTHKQFRQMLADKAREHRIPLQGNFKQESRKQWYKKTDSSFSCLFGMISVV